MSFYVGGGGVGHDDIDEMDASGANFLVSGANFLVSGANILVSEVSKLSTGAGTFRGP